MESFVETGMETPEHTSDSHARGAVPDCPACALGCECDGMVFVHHDLEDDVCDACLQTYFEIYPNTYDF